ncbi:Translocation protein S62 [Polyrhizophydium stewartii]|uniref:Translocation protein SEC62 n=1 Tax=Polyrhizophydium stewartii TaxID=2732419 RepID=A0ABR4NHA5_9FUNG|nr:Translocation protein S62 [Polyrhizophydium stewartii]
MTQVPADVLAVANYLRNVGESEFRLRQGFLSGKRVEFFKGKHAVNALLREPYRKKSGRPEIADRPAGEVMIARLMAHHMFIPASKQPGSTQLGLAPPDTPFSPDQYYIWVYEGSQWRGTLIGVGVLLLTFAGVMFPLWPQFLRQGVYYLSLVLMGLLGLLMAIAVLRIIIWFALVLVLGRGGWLFPNLWADVGFFESFVPLWAWDPPKKKNQ